MQYLIIHIAYASKRLQSNYELLYYFIYLVNFFSYHYWFYYLNDLKKKENKIIKKFILYLDHSKKTCDNYLKCYFDGSYIQNNFLKFYNSYFDLIFIYNKNNENKRKLFY
jgi:hypothetical protein